MIWLQALLGSLKDLLSRGSLTYLRERNVKNNVAHHSYAEPRNTPNCAPLRVHSLRSFFPCYIAPIYNCYAARRFNTARVDFISTEKENSKICIGIFNVNCLVPYTRAL